MSRPAAPASAVAALAAHELRLTARRGENVLVTIVIPAAVLVFFSTVAPGVPGTGGSAVDFLLPGALALALIASGLVSLGIATAYERSYGVLKRLGGAPLPRWGLMAAKIAALVAIEVVQVAVLLVVAVTVLGWSPQPGWSAGLFVVAAVLGTAAFAGLGLLLAGTLRAEATLALANGLFLGFLMLGGIVLPLDALPAPVEAVARLLPAGALSELFRASLGGGGGEPVVATLVLLAWAVGAVGLAVRTVRWE